jgi:hypothetical protein
LCAFNVDNLGVGIHIPQVFLALTVQYQTDQHIRIV